MGAMKRLLEEVYETLQKTEGFSLLGMDEQYHEATKVAQHIVDADVMVKKDNIERQIVRIWEEAQWEMQQEK